MEVISRNSIILHDDKYGNQKGRSKENENVMSDGVHDCTSFRRRMLKIL